MKLRVRTPDGRTLKVEAGPSDTIETVLAQVRSLSGDAELGSLSLNKKDILRLDATLEGSGVRGGDLVFLLSSQPHTSTPSTPAAQPPAQQSQGHSPGGRSLFGLPTAAPIANTHAGGQTVADSSGRVWEETVTTFGSTAGAAQSKAKAPKVSQGSAEEERLKRLQAIDRRMGGGGGSASAPLPQEPMPGSGLQRTVSALNREHNLNFNRSADPMIIGFHCILRSAGLCNAEVPDKWREGSGGYLLEYPVAVQGYRQVLVLKAVQIMNSLLLYAYLGSKNDRFELKLRVLDHVTQATNETFRLSADGSSLEEAFKSAVLSPLLKLGVQALTGTEPNSPEESWDNYTILLQHQQLFSVFREGLDVAMAASSVRAKPLSESEFLMLSVHVLFCCAGLVPEARPQGDVVMTDAEPGNDLKVPQELSNCILGLSESWRGKSCFSMCYSATVEGTPASVLLKGLSINRRLFIHARVSGGGAGGRCVLDEQEMAPRMSGKCVLTDSGLDMLIQLCCNRLLAPIGRAVRNRDPRPEAPSFSSLYSELKTHILAHLPAKCLALTACSNRKINSLAMNDLLWRVLVARDFGQSFVAQPLSRNQDSDGTWRGTYKALLKKKQQRRTAARQLFRIPFPLNPLAPWFPQGPRHPSYDPRFPIPWMTQFNASLTAFQERDVIRDTRADRFHGTTWQRDAPHTADPINPLLPVANHPPGRWDIVCPQRSASPRRGPAGGVMVLGLRGPVGGGGPTFSGGGGFRGF